MLNVGGVVRAEEQKELSLMLRKDSVAFQPEGGQRQPGDLVSWGPEHGDQVAGQTAELWCVGGGLPGDKARTLGPPHPL